MWKTITQNSFFSNQNIYKDKNKLSHGLHSQRKQIQAYLCRNLIKITLYLQCVMVKFKEVQTMLTGEARKMRHREKQSVNEEESRRD